MERRRNENLTIEWSSKVGWKNKEFLVRSLQYINFSCGTDNETNYTWDCAISLKKRTSKSILRLVLASFLGSAERILDRYVLLPLNH